MTGTGRERVSPKLLLKRAYAQYQKHAVTDSAATLSYYFVFALFPFLFLLATLTAYVPYVHASAETLLARARAILPPEAMAVIDAHVEGLVGKTRPHLLTLGLALTLYSVSRGVDAVRRALNLAYDVQETRPLWRTESLAFGMTIAGALLVLIGVAALAAGGSAGFWLARRVHIATPYVFVWSWLRWPVTAGVIALAAALTYWLLPNVRQPFKLITPGSVVGTVAWLLTTWAFSMYAGHFGSYNVTYGSIGGVIVLMTWFYLTGFIFLMGGELNAIVGVTPPERRDVEQPGAERTASVGPAAEAEADDKSVDQASIDSFPASDPPPWTTGHLHPHPAGKTA